ncbi:MAG TPA: restriction endonuclease subunit S [Chitinophagaceae bacterium]|nr:restriction endonuclease subunit S [Chitinophagaceae bacterium]
MITTKIKYKATGLKWISEIPEHWELKRLGGLFDERNETVSENDFNPLSVTMQGIVPQLESAAKTMHVDNRKKVCIGDFAINSRSDRRGSGGLSALEGSVSIVNTVLKPSAYYLPEYTHFLLTNKLFQDEYYAKGKGIVADMWSTRFSEMKTIFLPVPPKAEQDEIVQYIKAQEEKINLFIQKKQRFIELLKEQRQTIITNAITKGVDDNTKTKNSRVEWLGNVPEHWKIVRLKFLGESFIGLTYSPIDLVDKDEGTFVLRSSNIQNGKFTTDDNVYVNKEIPEKLILKKGDILLCSRNGSAELIGKNILIDEESEGNWFGAFMTVFRSDLNYYLYYFFNSNVFKSQTALFATSTINQLTNGILSNLTIAFPENIDEQKRIIEHIKTETATIDTAIAKADREIELIREYKEAMIAEAVMGKRK